MVSLGRGMQRKFAGVVEILNKESEAKFTELYNAAAKVKNIANESD